MSNPTAAAKTAVAKTAVAAVAISLTTLFTLPIHFKRWAKDSKGHKDLLALAAAGSIADFEAEVETVIDEETKEVGFKRKSLSFNVPTLDCTIALGGLLDSEAMTLAQVEHAQELVNQAIKKDIQLLVADTKRTEPLTNDNVPTWETTLAQPFNKRPVAIKVTTAMIEASVKPMVAWMASNGVGQGGIDLTESLCTKKFSIAALNGIETPIIEKVSGLVEGWFEALTDAEQAVHFPVVNLWVANIDAKLNPKQEELSIDMF